MRAGAAAVVLALFAGCPRGGDDAQAPAAPRRPSARSRGVVDTHLHISPTEIDRLHGIMDEVGIAWGLNLSGHFPGGPLERQLAAAAKSGRLLVACNLPWVAAREYEDFPKLAAQLLAHAKELGARGLKIEKALGLRVLKYDGTLLRVDDPWLDPIWTAAGELGLPVLIHTADPKAFWLPSDEKNERFEELSAHPSWSYYGEPVPSFGDLLAAFIRVVARHPKTKFVGVHFANNSEDPFWVAQMMDTHPNLYADLAARVPELGRHEAKKLREVFVRHARRILFGTDTGVSSDGSLMLGSYGEEPNKREEVGPYFAGHWRWLETADTGIPSMTPIQGRWTLNGLSLPDEVLDRIYRENAVELFGPAPAREKKPAATSSP